MAYIRAHETTTKRNGKPVKTYAVVWREPELDAFGLPIPANPDHPDGPKRMRARRETYPTRETAEARRDELNAARHTTGTSALAEQRKAGALPFGYYAQAWLAAQHVKAASSKDEVAPRDGRRLRTPPSGVCVAGIRRDGDGSITPAQREKFLAALVARGMSPATLKHHWSVLRNVVVYAHRHKAIASNPVDGVDFSGNSAQRRNKRHHPLTAEQVAAVAASVGERYPVYELFTLFAAYTGLRAEELAGCEIGDRLRPARVVWAPYQRPPCQEAPGRSLGGRHTQERQECPDGAPPALARGADGRLPRGDTPGADEPTAPLWPNRALGGSRRRGCRAVAALDFSDPVDPGAFYKNLFRPALEAVGLPASRPATTLEDGTPVPAVEGVRLHDYADLRVMPTSARSSLRRTESRLMGSA